MLQIQLQNPVHVDSEIGKELRGESGGLWQAENKWSSDWERKYSEWIAHEVDSKFWIRNGVATDCADIAYSLRWIFARVNKLEMGSRISASGDFLTHRSLRNEWAKLPTAEKWNEDKRFLAALNYLLDNTYTHSLMDDSYPISIGRDSLAEGVYHLNLHDVSGHTQVVFRTDQAPGVLLPFVILQSTTPRKVREVTMGGFFYTAQPKLGHGGLLRMRWPDFSNAKPRLIDAAKMPFYSLEQYAPEFLRTPQTYYNQEVYLRLNPTLDFQKVANAAYENLITMYTDRIQIVEDGFSQCHGSCAANSIPYEEWSTPSRDARILDLIAQIDLIRQSLPNFVEPDSLDKPLFLLQGESYTLKSLIAAWRFACFQSDPNLPPARRWGVSAEAVRDWIIENAKQLIQAREQKFAQKLPSTDEDRALDRLRWQAASYCSQSPQNQCSIWLSLLEFNSIEMRGRTTNLRDFLGRLAWFSSYPELSEEIRWGLQAKNFTWLDTLFFKKTQFAKGGWVWAREQSNQWKVFATDEKIPRVVVTGVGDLAGLVPDPAIAFEVSGQNLSLWNLDQKIQITEALDFYPDRARVVGTKILLSNSRTGEFQAGTLTKGQWQISARGIASWGLDSKTANESRGLLIGSGTESRLLDFSKPEAGDWKLPYLRGDQVRTVTEQAIYTKTGVFMKGTGTWQPHPEFGNLIAVHPSGLSGFFIEMNETPRSRFFTLTPEGKMELKEAFNGYAQRFGDLAVFWTGPNHVKLSWRAEKLSPVELLADEVSMESEVGPLAFAKLKNDRVRIRRNRQTIAELPGYAEPIFDSNGETPYFRIYDTGSKQTSVRFLAHPDQIVMAPVDFGYSSGAIQVDDGAVVYGSSLSNKIWLK